MLMLAEELQPLLPRVTVMLESQWSDYHLLHQHHYHMYSVDNRQYENLCIVWHILYHIIRTNEALPLWCSPYWLELETKLTKGVYTHWSNGYNIQSTHAPNKWQGGISLFWRTSEMYEIKEVELCGPNVLSFQLVLGATRWYIVGC
jgi:hypothetical protein